MTVPEDAGTATFTVTLSTASGRDVTVDYATADGTAWANPPSTEEDDYEAASGSLTFLPGQTSKTVVVTIFDPGWYDELDETFFLNLTNAAGASIADAQGVATMIDNDPQPNLSIEDAVSQDEACCELTLDISREGQSQLAGTVDYAVVPGSATSPDDFTASSGTMSVSGTDASIVFHVPIADDALDEDDETFSVVLSNGVNFTIVDDTGVGTITDDDPTPSLSVDDVTVTEGNSGTASATFTATLSAASGQAVSVNYATANNSAVAPGDFTAAAGTLNFAAGESRRRPSPSTSTATCSTRRTRPSSST